MPVLGEAVNVLVALTVICAFAYVYYDSDVLDEILGQIRDCCAVVAGIMLLMLLVLGRMDTFLDSSRELFHHIVGQCGLNCQLKGATARVTQFNSHNRSSPRTNRVCSNLKKEEKMPGNREAVNILVPLSVICAFAFVYSVSNVLIEILNYCLVAVAIVLLVAFVVPSRTDTFLGLSRVLQKIVMNSGLSGLLGPRAHHSSCHCHTISEATCGFMIQKLKYDVVKQIRDGVYQVNVENVGDVIYNLVPCVPSISRESYDSAAACYNEFVLKRLYYFKLNCNQVCQVMEHYDQNFEQWLRDNYLFDHRGKYLNPQFLQVLRDVLRGIGYLHHVRNRCHGNLSELNIVIVNGRGKITGMVNEVLKTYADDYLSLARIVRSCFLSEQQAIPTELELLLTYVSTTEPSRLLNIEHHPIFLSPLQRLCYRVMAHTFLYFGNKQRSFTLKLNKKLRRYKWQHKVGAFRMVLNRYKSFEYLPRKQRKSFQYNQLATSFLKFGRNVVVHLKDNLNREPGSKKLAAEEVEEELNRYWPEFLPILHQVLVDHGYLMVIHDAILK